MKNNSSAHALAQLFDSSQLEKQLSSRQSELFTALRTNIRRSILSMSPSDTLSFNQIRGDEIVRKIPCGASTEYVQALIAYMRGKPYDGYALDSYVTPVVLRAVEDTVVEFYASEETQKLVISEVFEQIKGNNVLGKVIRGEINANSTWLQHELRTIMAREGTSSIAGHVLENLATQITTFMTSAVGAKILTIVGHVLATSAGKILMTKIAIVVAKVLALGVLKPLLIVIVKNIGIAVIVKTVIGKVIIALLAALGIANIPIFWVIMPIIAGFLVYEYQTFPTKLADKVPDSVVDGIMGQFDTLNKSVVESLVQSIFDGLIEEITKIPA